MIITNRQILPGGLNVYSPDAAPNGVLYTGGWKTTADIGPDRLYQQNWAGGAPTEIVWNGWNPYSTYHLNDPSVVQVGGVLEMFVTALDNSYGATAAMFDRNLTGEATSVDGGASWTWQGIVIGQFNGYDGTGAWSPSALVVGNSVDIWYGTGAHDLRTGAAMPSRVLETTLGGATVQCMDTATGTPLSAENVDVYRAADGTYWLTGNDYTHTYDIVMYKSQDGVNWTPWSPAGPVFLASHDATIYTPTIIGVNGSNVDMMFSQVSNGVSVQERVTVDTSKNNNFIEQTVVGGKVTGETIVAGDAYIGPVSGLDSEIISITHANLNIIATTPNVFISAGDGDDGLRASSGFNVLNGGGGSNFLTGGPGNTTFFSQLGDVSTWSTITDFHVGDSITIWNVAAGNKINWQDGKGAAGYTGATGTISDVSGHSSSITLSGYSAAQASHLNVSFGTTGGLSYLAIN